MTDSILEIETELKKLVSKPTWKRKQNDSWDIQTNFIYHTLKYAELADRIKALANPYLKDYAINRWFNFWSAKGVEKIFCQCKGVEKCDNEKDRKVDFYIQGIPFDHKTTVFPQHFEKNYLYAKNHKPELIAWLYNKQSRQQRFHRANRLFVVMYKANGAHWQLRKELQILQPIIQNYIANFSPKILSAVPPSAVSDIIWFEE